MDSISKMFSGLTGSATTAVTGSAANSSVNKNKKVTGLGPNISPGNTHVNYGGMPPSQKGGRSNKNKNKNRSKKNRNRKNKSRKNRK